MMTPDEMKSDLTRTSMWTQATQNAEKTAYKRIQNAERVFYDSSKGLVPVYFKRGPNNHLGAVED